MRKPFLYVCKSFIDFSFVCNTSLNKSRFYDEENVIVQITHFDYNNTVNVLCWVDSVLKFEQNVKYIKNQKYYITYYPSKDDNLQSLKINIPKVLYNKKGEIIYDCKMPIHPQDAKKLFNYIKNLGLVSKPYWDKIIDGYDWKCLGCNESWVSNPDIGYVRKIFEAKQNSNFFWYKGKLYKPCEKHEYHRLTWYNEKEYNDLIKNYSPGEYPPFNVLWDKARKDENDSGGQCWRSKIDNEEITETEPTSDFEKIVTLGFHTTPPAYSEQCPVCNDLYEVLCRSGYSPLNSFQKLRELVVNRYLWRIQRLLRRIFHER